jgi:hypothetical protein
MTDPNFGCRWEYKGQPCQVKGVLIEDGEVIGMIVNTGIGPDIEAMLKELAYERLSD